MIRIVIKNGGFAPVITCDICGEDICDANNAAAVSNDRKDSGELLDESTHIEVLHAHKGDCLTKAETRLGGESKTGWIELRKHLYLLIHNCGFSLKDLQEMDDLERKIGRLGNP